MKTIILGWSGKQEIFTEFWQGHLLKSGHLEGRVGDKEIIFRWILRTYALRIRGRCNWFKSSGELFVTSYLPTYLPTYHLSIYE
jgi:hypothetical protein